MKDKKLDKGLYKRILLDYSAHKKKKQEADEEASFEEFLESLEQGELKGSSEPTITPELERQIRKILNSK